jgi:hypothetical protein
MAGRVMGVAVAHAAPDCFWHLPSDGVTMRYTVTPYEGQEIISIWHVKLDT